MNSANKTGPAEPLIEVMLIQIMEEMTNTSAKAYSFSKVVDKILYDDVATETQDINPSAPPRDVASKLQIILNAARANNTLLEAQLKKLDSLL